MIFSIRINEELVGKRTDKLLAEQLPQFPRAALQKLFLKELVLLNDEPIRAGIKLRLGDRLKADLSPLDIKIEDIDLPIIYEDNDVLVIDKPAGIISHARGRYFDEPSVASFIRQKVAIVTGERGGIVHRLDRATSGVMICAKNPEALSILQQQFSQRKTKKTYLAIIAGEISPEKAIIDMPIERNPNKPQTFRVNASGKPSLTHYEVSKVTSKHALLKLTPETGRTHQLRVHLKQVNRPIVGDQLYGGEEAERLYLHAYSLEITLPTGERKTFTAPVPQEFDDLLLKDK